MWQQKLIRLPAYPRGFHLVTELVVEQLDLASVKVGQVQLFLQHTSASLTLNENCDATVRLDMERYFRQTVPDNAYYQHDDEGRDDMPAHIKSALLGVSLVLPIQSGRLAFGTWQGIWLGEHRVHGGVRRILATVQGELKNN